MSDMPNYIKPKIRRSIDLPFILPVKKFKNNQKIMIQRTKDNFLVRNFTQKIAFTKTFVRGYHKLANFIFLFELCMRFSIFCMKNGPFRKIHMTSSSVKIKWTNF